jgi:symplekin
MLEADNDGIRTMAIKFMEIVILAQTPKEQKSEPPKAIECDVSLDIIPVSHELLVQAELQEEAGRAIGSLLSLTASPALSSVSLMACISSLTNIARQRPSNMSTVVQTFELLHANLPPHFATSQVTSVRKQLKSQVLSLLRHPSSVESREQITTLLTDLGCSQADIAKNSPKPESSKRARTEGDGSVPQKKIKLDEAPPESVGVGTEAGEAGDHKAATTSGYSNIEAIEMTAADLKSLLTPEAVTDLVMVSIRDLPRRIPKTFRSSYTPIAAAGTDAQVSHLARLLASQMTAVGIGVGAKSKNIQPPSKPSEPSIHRSSSPMRVVSDPRKKSGKESDVSSEKMMVQEEIQESPQDDSSVEKLAESMTELAYLGSLLGVPSIFDPMFPAMYYSFFGSYPSWMQEGMDKETGDTGDAGTPVSSVLSNLVTIPTSKVQEGHKDPVKKEKKPHVAPTPQKLKRIRVFDLSDSVNQMSEEEMKTMTLQAFRRILTTEKVTTQQGIGQARISILINLVTQFGGSYDNALLEFILEDLRANFDLAIAWLFAEYSITESYRQSTRKTLSYDACLTGLLKGACDKLEPRDRLFTRLVLEAPKITPSAMDIIKSYCCTEDRAFLGVTTLKELILKRPHGPQGTEDFLQVLLEITLSNIELARVQALHIAKKFYGKPELASKIERFALQSLQYLLSDFPPFQEDTGDMEVASEWTEETVNLCLQLFISLLPLNHKLLKDLAIIYTSTTPAVKRIILKHIDKPVRAIGMDSPDLLRLVESCPVGGETLIMRMLYILTENC